MLDASGRAHIRFTPRALRLPLVAVVGALSMGSGLGNPGCDSSCIGSDSSGGSGSVGEPWTPPPCDESCDKLAGTYRLTFENTRPLGAGCDTIGLKLPTEVVLSRKGDRISTQVQGLELIGPYYGEPDHEFRLEVFAQVALAGGQSHPISLTISGKFAQVPLNAQEPATFKASYYASRVGQISDPEGTPQCEIGRDFSANR